MIIPKNDYFDIEENVTKLKTELERWRGTRFMYSTGGIAEPGCYADCLSFPLNVFKNIGLIPADYQAPDYASRRSGRHELQKIYDCLDAFPNTITVWEKGDCDFYVGLRWIYTGDIIVASTGIATHHLMIYVDDDHVWHCWPNDGVTTIHIGERIIYKYAQKVYRFKCL